jgi:hypothetical protein
VRQLIFDKFSGCFSLAYRSNRAVSVGFAFSYLTVASCPLASPLITTRTSRVPDTARSLRAHQREINMPRHRLTYTERRRTRLARKVDRLEACENRHLITEPIAFFAAGLGLPTAISMVMGPLAGQTALPRSSQPQRGAAKTVSATPLLGSTPPTAMPAFRSCPRLQILAQPDGRRWEAASRRKPSYRKPPRLPLEAG